MLFAKIFSFLHDFVPKFPIFLMFYALQPAQMTDSKVLLNVVRALLYSKPRVSRISMYILGGHARFCSSKHYRLMVRGFVYMQALKVSCLCQVFSVRHACILSRETRRNLTRFCSGKDKQKHTRKE